MEPTEESLMGVVSKAYATIGQRHDASWHLILDGILIKLLAQGVEILVYMWVVDTTPDVAQEGGTAKVP